MGNDNSEIVKIPEKIRSSESTTHREFRLATMLLLPMIDPKDARSPKEQINTDPLSVRDRKVLSYYSTNRDVVDALNLAYATKQAVGRKNSKATVLGYRSARGHAIGLSANRTWMDRAGNTYSTFMDVPQHIRDYLLKLLHRDIAAQDDNDADEGAVDEEGAEPNQHPMEE